MKTFNLNQGELDSMVILERIRKNELTQAEAAHMLKISDRQLRRRLKRYLLDGPDGLAHKGRGKPSNRSLPKKIVAEIFQLLQEKYLLLREKPGPTFVADQLKKTHGITIDHETLRRLMISKGLWTVSNRKRRRHQWRERKHHVGELVQIDGSLHLWFGEEQSWLVAFIDDATSKIAVAEFVDGETTKDLGNLTHEYVQKYGRPLAQYCDRGGVYKVNNNNDGKLHKTQYERMLQELDIKLIHARSPQAKGRIERLFGTLQDRLVKELELAGITTRDAANEYLKNVYIPEHNARFAEKPLNDADFHRPIDRINVQAIFCLKFERTINDDYTVVFKNVWFQIKERQQVFVRRGQRVQVHENFDGTIDLLRDGKRLEFKRIAKKTSKPKTVKKEKEDRRGQRLVYYKPPPSHPWRHRVVQPDISTELKKGHF